MIQKVHSSRSILIHTVFYSIFENIYLSFKTDKWFWYYIFECPWNKWYIVVGNHENDPNQHYLLIKICSYVFRIVDFNFVLFLKEVVIV